jgi:hypothetical protein
MVLFGYGYRGSVKAQNGGGGGKGRVVSGEFLICSIKQVAPASEATWKIITGKKLTLTSG